MFGIDVSSRNIFGAYESSVRKNKLQFLVTQLGHMRISRVAYNFSVFIVIFIM